MNHVSDPALHGACARAFLTAIGRSVEGCLTTAGSLSTVERETLRASLLFAIGAHLAGSSHGGAVDGREVYPVVGFSVGEESDIVYFGDSSSLAANAGGTP